MTTTARWIRSPGFKRHYETTDGKAYAWRTASTAAPDPWILQVEGERYRYFKTLQDLKTAYPKKEESK